MQEDNQRFVAVVAAVAAAVMPVLIRRVRTATASPSTPPPPRGDGPGGEQGCRIQAAVPAQGNEQRVWLDCTVTERKDGTHIQCDGRIEK